MKLKRKLLMAAVAVAILGSSMTVCAAPQYMVDGNVFDAEWYLEQYPDVKAVWPFAATKSEVYVHYVSYGAAEGRLPYNPATLDLAKILPYTAGAAVGSAVPAVPVASVVPVVDNSGISVEELLAKYKEYADQKRGTFKDANGYGFAYINNDELPELFITNARDKTENTFRWMVYYDKNKGECAYLELSRVYYGIPQIEYAKKEGWFASDDIYSSNAKTYYRLNDEGSLATLGYAYAKKNGYGDMEYGIGIPSKADWTGATWRNNVSKREYDEFVSSLGGAMNDRLTSAETSITIDLAYPKFLSK